MAAAWLRLSWPVPAGRRGPLRPIFKPVPSQGRRGVCGFKFRCLPEHEPAGVRRRRRGEIAGITVGHRRRQRRRVERRQQVRGAAVAQRREASMEACAAHKRRDKALRSVAFYSAKGVGIGRGIYVYIHIYVCI